MGKKTNTGMVLLKTIEAHLIRWARWVKNVGKLSLGYPGETRESRFMKQGCLPPPCNYQQKDFCDDEVAVKTELTIRKMPPHLRIVVEKHYLSQGTIQQKAKELDMCRVTFHEHLRMAKYWMHGYFGAEEQSTVKNIENRLQ